MKKIFPLYFLLIACGSVQQSQTWLVIGQSNSIISTSDLKEFGDTSNLEIIQTQPGYSELAGYFGADLSKVTGDQVEVIAAGIAGTSINCWLKNSDCYAKSIAPLVGTHLDGVVFWQGEEDFRMSTEEYKEKFESFISQVRQDFQNQNLPIIYVRLETWDDPGFAVGEGEEDGSSNNIRLAQDQAKEIPCTKEVSATDLSDGNLHPKIKDKIAQRMVDGIRELTACQEVL